MTPSGRPAAWWVLVKQAEDAWLDDGVPGKVRRAMFTRMPCAAMAQQRPAAALQ